MSVYIDSAATNKNGPRVLWEQQIFSVAAVAGNQAPLYPATNMLMPQTYTSWRPLTVPATVNITLQLPSAAPWNAFAVGAHTLGSSGATLQLQTFSFLSGWVTIFEATPEDDSAILFLTTSLPQSCRIIVSNAICEIGVLMVGRALEFPRAAQFSPAQPISEAEQYRYNVNMTDGGSWAGRTAVSQGLQFGVQINNLSEDFAESPEWRSFRDHCNKGASTFFIAPKPQSYPREVAYCMSGEVVRAQRNRTNKEISRTLELNCMGYAPL